MFILSNMRIDAIKYPRTPHLPWSDGIMNDDRVMSSVDVFRNHRVIVTEKMDGENTSMYSNYIHARSVDSRHHQSRNWIKQYWSTIRYKIPSGWRVCGENLYARHSIEYNNLPSYFLGFSIWTNYMECMSWDETIHWFDILGIISVPVLYDGPFDEAKIRELHSSNSQEGYVVRFADKFLYTEFHHNVGKYVRKNHNHTDKTWLRQRVIIQNGLLSR